MLQDSKLFSYPLSDENALPMFYEFTDIDPCMVRMRKVVKIASQKLLENNPQATLIDLIKHLSDENNYASMSEEFPNIENISACIILRLEKNAVDSTPTSRVLIRKYQNRC